MSIYGTLAGLMNVEARTSLLNSEAQDYAVLAQERNLRVQEVQRDQQDEMYRRQLIRDMSTGMKPSQVVNGQVVQGDSPLSDMQSQIARDQQSAQQLRQIANVMSTSPDVSMKAQKQAEAEAVASEKALVGSQREYRLEQSNLMKQVGSVAGAGLTAIENGDQDGFRRAYSQLAQLNPALVQEIGRDRNGIPDMTDPKSKSLMTTLANEGQTRTQQLELQDKALALKLRQDEAARKSANAGLETQKLEAEVAATKALGAERKAKEDEIKAKGERDNRKYERLQGAATKPATAPMIDMARKDILSDSEFKDLKFEETGLAAFAGAVADRANKIRAESARAGEEMDFADARQQAISELRQYVKPAEVGEKKIIGTDITIPFTGEKKYTYTRGGTAPVPAQTGAASEQEIVAAGKKMNDAGLDFKFQNGTMTDKSGEPLKIANKAQYDSLPSGTKFIGPDGKPWTKP